jgi:hypothetical protein
MRWLQLPWADSATTSRNPQSELSIRSSLTLRVLVLVSLHPQSPKPSPPKNRDQQFYGHPLAIIIDTLLGMMLVQDEYLDVTIQALHASNYNAGTERYNLATGRSNRWMSTLVGWFRKQVVCEVSTRLSASGFDIRQRDILWNWYCPKTVDSVSV